MKKVKIRLTNDWGHYIYLTINYFPKRRSDMVRRVDEFYLTDHACYATAVPVKEACKWLREAKHLASYDGDVIVKAEYLLAGKPTTLKAAGLR